jgi:hypothetical protein
LVMRRTMGFIEMKVAVAQTATGNLRKETVRIVTGRPKEKRLPSQKIWRESLFVLWCDGGLPA